MSVTKRMLAALATATLAAGVVAAPAAATEERGSGARHSHTGEWVLKPEIAQYSTDVGATWSNTRPDNFDNTLIEYSSDSGSTWTATKNDYDTGEAGENDGANMGTYRRRTPHQIRWEAGGPEWTLDGGTTWSAGGNFAAAAAPTGFTASNAQHQKRQTWLCRDDAGEALTSEGGPLERLVTDPDGVAPAPSGSCAVWHSGPFRTNVDDDTQPPGDWCVSGANAMICRGEGYTYNEAKTRLGF